MAGGGGLLTFPVLMTVVTPVRDWFWLLLGPSLLGGLLGALLLNWSGNQSFVELIRGSFWWPRCSPSDHY